MQAIASKEIDAIRTQILDESPFGEVTIRDVRVREQADFDDAAYVHLVVYADPATLDETWPVKEVLKLRRRVLELATESAVELPEIAVDIYPEQDREQRHAHDSAEW